MKKACLHKTCSIRFRRWSRKGYAAFVGLQREVTIGRVCRSIADAALSKNKSFSTANRKRVVAALAGAEGCTGISDEGGGTGFLVFVLQEEVAGLLLLGMPRVATVGGKAVSCRKHGIYNKVSGMGKARKRVSPVPLFCCFNSPQIAQIYKIIILHYYTLRGMKLCILMEHRKHGKAQTDTDFYIFSSVYSCVVCVR